MVVHPILFSFLLGAGFWALGAFLAWNVPVTNLSRSTFPAILLFLGVVFVFGAIYGLYKKLRGDPDA